MTFDIMTYNKMTYDVMTYDIIINVSITSILHLSAC